MHCRVLQALKTIFIFALESYVYYIYSSAIDADFTSHIFA